MWCWSFTERASAFCSCQQLQACHNMKHCLLLSNQHMHVVLVVVHVCGEGGLWVVLVWCCFCAGCSAESWNGNHHLLCSLSLVGGLWLLKQHSYACSSACRPCCMSSFAIVPSVMLAAAVAGVSAVDRWNCVVCTAECCTGLQACTSCLVAHQGYSRQGQVIESGCGSASVELHAGICKVPL